MVKPINFLQNKTPVFMLKTSYRREVLVHGESMILNGIEFIPSNYETKKTYEWVGDFAFLDAKTAAYFIKKGFARAVTDAELEKIHAHLLMLKGES